MANIDTIIKGVKSAEKIAKPVANLVGVAAPLAAIGGKIITDKIEEKKSWIEIPRIFSAKGYVKLQQAKSYLEEAGLRAGEAIVKESIAFKDCAEFDVVGRSYKCRKRVPPATRIVLYYVTAEVIEKSKQLFIEAEKEKAELARKKIENGEKARQMVDDVVTNVKQHAVKAAANSKMRMKKITPNRSRPVDR